MRKLFFHPSHLFFFLFFLTYHTCKRKILHLGVTQDQIETPFDSTLVQNFYRSSEVKNTNLMLKNYTANINSIMYGMTTTGK
jgi:hypothetical protein